MQMIDLREMKIGWENATIGTEIMIGTVIIATKTAVIIAAGADTHTLALPANPTEDTIEIVMNTDAETPAVLRTKETATITLPTLADIDHDISLKRTY